MRFSIAGAVAALLTLLPPGSVDAQCAEGRVVGADTSGRCCWPGQRWNDAAARCEGPPACPEGWGAEGDECVRSGSTFDDPGYDELALDEPRTSPPPGGEWGSAEPAVTGGWLRPTGPPRTEPFMEWLHVGITLLSVGYGASVTHAVLGLGSYGFGSELCFIPLVGALLWPLAGNGSLVLGLPSFGVQLVGLVTMLVAGIARRPVRSSSPWHADGGPRLTSGPGELGLGLEWGF